MSGPVVSRLWIAAAEHALDAQLVDVPQERKVEVRSQLRVAATTTAEDMINLVGGPRGAVRSTTIAALVERSATTRWTWTTLEPHSSRRPSPRRWRTSASTPPRPIASPQLPRRVREAPTAIDTLIPLTVRRADRAGETYQTH